MTTPNAYSFLPWLRQGVSTQIKGQPDTATRASVSVKLRLDGIAPETGAAVGKDVEHKVQIYGPGDVVGVDSRAIVRTEPRDWITNFEPNYFPFIEFYEEDFLWRYSPGPADATTRRLEPWLALVVLAKPEGSGAGVGEFDEFPAQPGKPLPAITVRDLGILPPEGQLGAWAHVHVNETITASDSEFTSTDMPAVLSRLRLTLNRNPDLACSRLICPRRLEPNTPYHAFLVPAYETGRLSGLGIDPTKSPGALTSSWHAYEGRPEAETLPYYHRWFFRTGSAGDFEDLVRLIKPRELSAEVGNRDIDVQRPGVDLPPIDNADLHGVLRLGGALKVPDQNLTAAEKAEAKKYEEWDNTPAGSYPHPFQKALATLINLADTYATTESTSEANNAFLAAAGVAPAQNTDAAEEDPDPLVTPPLYGQWHALTNRLLVDETGAPITPNDNWVHRLNLDPRFRVPAGFGTKVIQDRQEELMAAAWEQIGEVLEVNKRIRAAQLGREVGHVLHQRNLQALDESAPGKAMAVTGPAQSRVTVAPTSNPSAAATATPVAVGYRVSASVVASAPLTAAMRRLARPGSRLVRGLFPPPPPESARLADTPPAPRPEDLLNRIDAPTNPVTAAKPKATPAGLVTAEAVDKEVDPPIIIKLTGRSDVQRPVFPPVRAVQVPPPPTLPESHDFELSLPGDTFVAHIGPPDSPESGRFKAALNEIYWAETDAAENSKTTARPRLDVANVSKAAVTELNPDITVRKRFRASVSGIPDRFATHYEKLIEVMAYPVFDLPMYETLLKPTPELFLPNVNLIPPNTVSLLETNQRFIEAFMVGLNHEMARELLWREYPTDLRGTPFRQFWDVQTVLPIDGEEAEDRRERLSDIQPIHTWLKTEKLGDHDNREAGGPAEEELVLVIRGELLKKYPTAVIYAHRAQWLPDNEHPDLSRERILDPRGDNLDPQFVRLPLYEARIEPDIFLFGFDLTEEEAHGGTGTPPDPGWFFVIKERPGDPRFGLDVTHADPQGIWQVWNDLAWPDVVPAGKNYVPMDASTPTLTLTTEPPRDPYEEKLTQWGEDKNLPTWKKDLSSADIAYMTFQAPMLMAVHASEMLGTPDRE